MSVEIHCPICRQENKRVLYSDIYDDRYGYPDQFEIIECQSCLHLWTVGPYPSDLKDLYSNYYPRRDFDPAKAQALPELQGFKSWFNGERRSYHFVAKGSRVLDIGCGSCETLLYHKQRGCEAYGIESDSNAQKVADLHQLHFKFGVFDRGLYPAEHFDFVTMDQVIEHFRDPVLMLEEIHRILKANGKLILTTPNAMGWGARTFKNKWINWHIPYHLHFFNRQSLILAAEKSGFEVQFIKTETSSEWLFYQLIHLIYFPIKGVASGFWGTHRLQGSVTLNDQQSKWLHRIHKLRDKKALNILTRFFDFFGIGDNLIAVLIKR